MTTKYFKIYGIFIVIFFVLMGTHKIKAQPNPVICMPFNMDALDISGNNHHGDVNGAVLTSDRFGNPNSAFDFDGVDDNIQILDSIGSYLPGDEVTLVFWARANAVGNNSPILLLPNNNSDRLNVHIHYDNNGTESTFWDYGNIGGGGRLNIPNVPFQSVWDHYAFVMSATADSLIVYKNGVYQAGKANVSSLNDRTRLLHIGGGVSDITNCYFNGQIDDVQIFDVALTALEISDNYINSNSCMSIVQNQIRGKIYYDSNSNNIQDVGESAYINASLNEINTNRTCYTFADGSYIFGIDSIGTFEIAPNIALSYYQSNPLTHTATFLTLGESDSLNDFALQPTGVFNDLRITISPLTPFRPGFVSAYNLHYQNVGTTILGGDVVFYPDSLITYDTASVSPVSVTADSIIWNISPLQPFEDGNIIVYAILQIGTPNNTLINSTVKIEPVSGDEEPVDNYNAWEVFSTGSYDPNDISVSNSFIDISEAGNPPYLQYMIRFQNTGNDTAFTVRIENVLPVELNSNTFEFISSSDNCVIDYNTTTRTLNFIHNNILLPDSNINEPESHGYIIYRIKPVSNLLLGNIIPNTAGIYFDFNSPVITNTALTEITNFTGINDISNNSVFEILPNPTSGKIEIRFSEIRNLSSTLILLDIHGKEIINHEVQNIGNSTYMDLKNLDSGIYFVKYSIGETIAVKKVLKF